MKILALDFYMFTLHIENSEKKNLMQTKVLNFGQKFDICAESSGHIFIFILHYPE